VNPGVLKLPEEPIRVVGVVPLPRYLVDGDAAPVD
jgi:hypothetical protein